MVQHIEEMRHPVPEFPGKGHVDGELVGERRVFFQLALIRHRLHAPLHRPGDGFASLGKAVEKEEWPKVRLHAGVGLLVHISHLDRPSACMLFVGRTS